MIIKFDVPDGISDGFLSFRYTTYEGKESNYTVHFDVLHVPSFSAFRAIDAVPAEEKEAVEDD